MSTSPTASTSRRHHEHTPVRSDRCRSFKKSKSDKVLPEACVSITTFNILAPIYKRIGNEDCRESQYHDAWFKRNAEIINMLTLKRSSIICLQEFWLGNEELVHLYEESFGCAGYDTFRLARTSDRGDGLLTAINRDRISVLNCKDLKFNDCGDRVAQFFHLRVRVPFFKRNQIAEQQLLLVNTHLLFPHDSNFCLVRLGQVYKILECLEQFKVEYGLASAPVILCGDWNGSKRGHVYKFLRSQGFVSCYDSAHSYNDNDAHQWVSHRNHRGNICGVDFIWLRNPSNNLQSLSTSWGQAVLGIIMTKMCEAGLSWKDILGCIQPKGMAIKLTLYDLQRMLHQRGLTERCAESLISEEIQVLMQSLYVDASDLIDSSAEVMLPMAGSILNKGIQSSNNGLRASKEMTWAASPPTDVFNSSVRSETAPGLAIQDASLFPPEVELGLWPEDYVLSDHAPLTASFRPRRACD
ncbi:hypothetical protein GOP47_0009275 [Adiantum capillus-veneris]|uniref:Endonuclease/exonuclease/phosphatase domain-containing protein n=1 Tax=Adiantum capillus-veneris TaxID=13818 RepID=A0A9D4UWA7_ADICA|nr:hypothetical protein GOP47_0009275 [Adiantum capillus-veneris]